MAETVTEVLRDTGEVLTVKLALLEPAGTTTVAGTLATVVLLLKETVISAAATPFNVTVPIDGPAARCCLRCETNEK